MQTRVTATMMSGSMMNPWLAFVIALGTVIFQIEEHAKHCECCDDDESEFHWYLHDEVGHLYFYR